jgi:hypothetical protein
VAAAASDARGGNPPVVLIVFGLLAFSDDIAEAAVDLWEAATGATLPDGVAWAVVIAVDVVLILSLWRFRERPRPAPNGRAWLVSGGVFIGLDGLRLALESWWDPPALILIVSLLVYLPLLLALYTYARGRPFYGPVKRWMLGGRAGDDDRIVRDTVLPALPLVVGAGIAWTAGVLWKHYIRPEGTDVTEGVNPEFFAQMSAVIPVLLLALVIETHVLRASRTVSRPRRELNIYVVVVIVLGEAMALSALPVRNARVPGGAGKVLPDWHEYIAFDLTVFAVGVALATVVLLAAGGLRDEPEALAVRVVENT